MIKAVRGTRDLLPPETALWNFVESAVRDVFRAYNFQEIRTPIFESTELFARGVGEETDVVSKEMYLSLIHILLRTTTSARSEAARARPRDSNWRSRAAPSAWVARHPKFSTW